MKTKIIIVVLVLLNLIFLSSCNTPNENPPSGLLIKADGSDMLSYIDEPIAAYSPFMSRVPGFPIELSFPDSKISVTVDYGTILFWGEDTSDKVLEKGQTITFNSPYTIYWSPLDDKNTDSNNVQKATMNIEFDTQGTCVNAVIEFNMDLNDVYTATLKQLDTNEK